MPAPKDPEKKKLWQERLRKAFSGERNPNFKGGRVEVRCSNCSKKIWKKRYLLDVQKRFFCDYKCAGEWRSKSHRGVNNPNYGRGDKIRGEKNYNWKPRISAKCSFCGGILHRRASELKGVKNIFCDKACRIQWLSREMKGIRNPFFNQQHTERAKATMKANHADVTAEKNPMFGQKRPDLAELNRSRQGQALSGEHIKAILKGCRIKPNKAELKLFSVLQKHFPGHYAINVKGEALILAGKIPDFVNIQPGDGNKKLIELFGNYWHAGDDPRDRIIYFKQFGFETLVIWESELEDEKSLIEKLKVFDKV